MPTAQISIRTTWLMGCSRVTSRATGLFSPNCARRAFPSISARHIATLINPLDPKQTTNPSTKAASIKATGERKNLVVTLDPDKFHAAKQQMVNVSKCGWFNVGPQRITVRIGLEHLHLEHSSLPCPRGYLYYRKPPPDKSLAQGELRIRMLSSDAHSFDEGKDLEFPTGETWKLSLSSMVHTRTYAPLVKILLSEGTITRELVTQIEKTPRHRLILHSTALFSPTDTFVTDMQTQPYSLRILCPDGMIKILKLSRTLFASRRKSAFDSFIYKGVLRLRIEPSPVTEKHTGFHIVFRVVEIIEPVVPIVSELDLEVAKPVEGELIHRRIPGINQFKPYVFASRTPSHIPIFEHFFGDSNPFK